MNNKVWGKEKRTHQFPPCWMFQKLQCICTMDWNAPFGKWLLQNFELGNHFEIFGSKIAHQKKKKGSYCCALLLLVRYDTEAQPRYTQPGRKEGQTAVYSTYQAWSDQLKGNKQKSKDYYLRQNLTTQHNVIVSQMYKLFTHRKQIGTLMFTAYA